MMKRDCDHLQAKFRTFSGGKNSRYFFCAKLKKKLARISSNNGASSHRHSSLSKLNPEVDFDYESKVLPFTVQYK